MRDLYMYLCDTCGRSEPVAGMCSNCETPLTLYTKETQAEYQNYEAIQDGMRRLSLFRWHL